MRQDVFNVGVLAVLATLAVQPTETNTPMRNFARPVVPVSATVGWTTVVEAGAMDDQDAATVTEPDTEIGDPKRLFKRGYDGDGEYFGNEGVLITVRLAYDDGISGVTEPVVKCFGRHGDEAWTLLETKDGNLSATIDIDTTNDVSNGTLNFTTPDPDQDAWDTQGCSEFRFAVETALAATGDVTTAYLEAKIY